MTSILDEAAQTVNGDRNRSYGHPYDNLGRTAMMWTAILGKTVTAEQVALCMVAMKISRQIHRPNRDNLVDAAGYLATIEQIQAEHRRRHPHPHRYKDTNNA